MASPSTSRTAILAKRVAWEVQRVGLAVGKDSDFSVLVTEK